MEKVTVEFDGRFRVIQVAEAWTCFVCEGRFYRRNRHGIFVFRRLAEGAKVAAA